MVGNLTLQPEKATTVDVGFVLQPSFATGLSISADYYDIKIKDAIQSVTPQDIISRCYDGITRFCGAFVRDPTSQTGQDLIITNSPFNFVEQRARGLDLEATYKFQLSSLYNRLPGDLTLHALGTHYMELLANSGADPAVDYAGTNTSNSLGTGPPHWLYRVTADYHLDQVQFSLTARGVSSGKYDNTYVECTTDCPASSTLHGPSIPMRSPVRSIWMPIWPTPEFRRSCQGTGVFEGEQRC